MRFSRVLVTGGTGFVGSHLVEHLLHAGAQVRCLVRPGRTLRYLDGLNVELAPGELTPAQGLNDALHEIDTVFHLAGLTKTNNPQDFYSANVTGTENLLAACSAAAIDRFVHVSSLAAVGPSGSGKPIPEDVVAPLPLGHYGASKLESEIRVRHSPLADRSVIVRPPVVFGPRDTDVFEIFRSVSRGFLLKIGPEESYFSLIYVKDLAEGLLAAARCDQAAGNTYFLSNAEPLSWTGFATLAAAHMHRRFRSVSLPYRLARLAGHAAEIQSRLRKKPGILSREKVAEARCRFWVCDPSKASRELGFVTRTPLPQAVAETLDWYKGAGWLKF